MQAEGYIKGRPLALSVLDYGLFQVHATGRVIGICGFLIRTDRGEAVLVDTGFPAKYADNAHQATLHDGLDAFGDVLRCTPENRPDAQLAKLALAPEDITLHICTHTHIDHIGGLDAFSHAPLLISAAERALPRPLYWGDVQPLAWPEQTYLEVAGDLHLGPGLEVLAAPGHTPGQIALMLDLPETGAVLLTSDAISRPAEMEEGFAGAWAPEAAKASAERLMALAQEREALVIYGHCPAQWATLKKAPDAYR